MLPIPTHLEKILIPMGDENTEFHVDGCIRCSCGCESFHIKVYANITKGYPQVMEYGDGFAFVVKVICADCGKEHLIFDDNKHGWDGFVCHAGVEVPDNKLKSWKCPDCGCDVHEIRVSISSQGKDDFIEESGIADGDSTFNEDDWVNAFEWITIGLKCHHCGHDDERWIDYETM